LVLMDFTTTSDGGAYFNSSLVLQESMISTAPEFSAGTPWLSNFNVRLNDNHQMLCHGSVNDPDIPTGGDQAMVLVTLDEDGHLLGESAIMKEDDLLPGQTDLIQAFGTQSRSVDFNNHGDLICFVDTQDQSTEDGNIYKTLNGVPVGLAREGHTSPVPGRDWSSLLNPSVALNDDGGHAFIGVLEGDAATKSLPVRNGEPFIQQGDRIPALSPWGVENFHTAPIFLSNTGDLFWFCMTDDSDRESDTAIFRNLDPLIQEGHTWIDGQIVDTLWVFGETFYVSPNGRYMIFRAVLDDGLDGAFLLDMGLVAPMAECSGNEGSLSHVAGLPLLEETLELEMTAGQTFGVTPVLMLSTDPIAGWPPCGLPIPAGELLLDFTRVNGNPFFYDVGIPWAGQPISFYLPIPDEALLIGSSVFAQGLFWAIGNMHPEEKLRLTGGIHITIVAP